MYNKSRNNDEKELNETYIGNVHRHDMIYKYYCKYASKRALGFCCSREHAEEMARDYRVMDYYQRRYTERRQAED